MCLDISNITLCVDHNLVRYKLSRSTFIRIVKHRSTEDFDSLPYVCTLLNSSLWTYYGLINDEVLVSTINGFGVLVEIVYVALFLAFAPRRMKVKTGILVGTVDIGFCGAAIVVTKLALQGKLRIGALGVVCAALNIIMYGSPLAAMVRYHIHHS
ncbi:hypothetical protein Cgig2_019084 [Carnegiea gigantea]|uniref:Uncharacterized protein n=1 Tax=Carnegiea gigantea TaxID=171969 RepID=A0A9Q1KEB8_9CARY|nr:hypothetical protein Cgig2_019084 [Carnegiea gigantea]